LIIGSLCLHVFAQRAVVDEIYYFSKRRVVTLITSATGGFPMPKVFIKTYG
jgi:hypothetical protein